MPAPKWFQKLRRRKKGNQQAAAACRSPQFAAAAVANAAEAAADDRPSSRRPSSSSSLPAPAACAVSPNRASYYFASAERARQDRELPCAADVALDVRVDVVHRRAGERRRLGGLDAPPGTPELKLRRIVTRHAGAGADASESGCGGGFSSATASATTSAATTPSTRARGFHVKPAGGRRRRQHRRRSDHDGDGVAADKKGKAAMVEAEESPLHRHGAARRRRWLYESLVVVKASSDPEREMAESMAEMVVANGLRDSEDLEELLACYLALNAAEHHRAVVAAFRHVWSLLDRHSLLL